MLQTPSRTDKRKLGREVGRGLVQQFGRKAYYTRIEILRILRRIGFPDAWSCWAYSLYLSPADFAAHHAAIGEACDYSAMRETMVDAVAGSLPDAFDASQSWLDWNGFDPIGDILGGADVLTDHDVS
ncbi:MAG TPA: hypothetical protein VKB52_12355 [Rhodanobacteraceae bacterium]|nr:hypothetical protein [Rhodanobacteraceae bacterium]